MPGIRLSFSHQFPVFLIITAISLLHQAVAGQSAIPEQINRQVSDLRKDNRFDEAIDLLRHYAESFGQESNSIPVIEARITEADLNRMKGSFKRSADLLDSIYVPVIESNSVFLSAWYHMVRSTLYLARGELKKGKSAILTAIELYSQSAGREDTLLAPCYNKLGNYYYFVNDYDSAMHWYSTALKINEKKKDNLEEKASYLQNIGIIQFELGYYSKAETCFLESLKIKESLYSSNNFNLGRLYMNLGRFYQGILASDKALYYNTKAEKIYNVREGQDHIELAKIFWNKGLIYYLSGESELALTYLFKAKTIIDSVFSENQHLMASLYRDIANVYKYADNFERAIFYYNRALSGADTTLHKKALRNLANLYHLQGEMVKAGEYFSLLMNASRNTLHQENVENGLNFLYYGYYLLQSDNDSALYFLDRSFQLFNGSGSFFNLDVAASLILIANYYHTRHDYGQALVYYQKSLSAIFPGFTDPDIRSNPGISPQNPDIRAITALSKKADCLIMLEDTEGREKNLMAAARAYELCFDLIDQMRTGLIAETSQMLLQFKSSGIYKEAINNCIALYDLTHEKRWLEQAFQISERNRSMVLLSELRDANAKIAWSVPESLIKAEKEIRRNVSLYRNNILEEENQPAPDENKLDFLRSHLFLLEKKHDSLRSHFEHFYPEYYNYRYDYSVVTVSKLQKILKENEAVIEYAIDDESVYIFLVTDKHFEVVKVEIDPNLAKNIYNLRDNLDFDHVMSYSYEAFMEYQILAYKLYDNLIKPVSEFIKDKKLIIIPDEELNYLSFESLVQNITPSDTISFKNLPYLLKYNPVSYAPSSTILALMKKGRMSGLDRGVLALAPSSDMSTRGLNLSNELMQELARFGYGLPGATHEAETILKVMHGKKLIGEEATESEFKKMAGEFDILHFATHTSIDDKNPLSSILSFYPYGDQKEDGMLHTYEIYNLDLKGELAVLSACSTGGGKLEKGEGVISLARAFTYAGMPSVVMTLWDVEDVSTGNILPYFYHSLGKGVEKDIALRQAKLNYLSNSRPEIEHHPAFWSGFVLYGNNRGFKQKPDNIFLNLILMLGGMIILISFVLIRKYIHYRKKPVSFDIDIPSKFRSENRF